MNNNKLFYIGPELSDALRSYPGTKENEIKNMDLQKFASSTDGELITDFAAKYHIPKIVLNEEGKGFSDVSSYEYNTQNTFNRLISLTGKRVTFYVPYTGSDQLFDCKLDFFANQSIPGYIKDKKVCHDICLEANQTVEDHGVALAKEWYRQLKINIEKVNAMVEEMNNEYLKPAIIRGVHAMTLKAASTESTNNKLKESLKTF